MHDARPLLAPFLTEEDYQNVATRVSAAYKACNEHMHAHDALWGFLPGRMLHSWIISPFVDYSITKVDGMTLQFKPNKAHNWFQTTHYKSGLALTCHFMGTGKSQRGSARKAVVRAALNDRNLDLFGFESTQPDAAEDFAYCHLLHSGFDKAESITLAIPYRDQNGHFAAMTLDPVEPEQIQVEEIREEVIVSLLTAANEKRETSA